MRRFIILLLVTCPLIASAQGAGNLWEPLPLQFADQVGTLYADPSGGDLYITNFVGKVNGKDSSLVKWDGHQADITQPPFDNGMDVAAYKGKLIVSGVRYSPTTPYKLCSFDGLSWSTLDSFKFGEAPGAMSVLDSHLVVTGTFNSIAGHSIKLAALWDGGTGWSDLNMIDTCMPVTSFINAIVQFKGEIFVGGNIRAPRSITHIARFDGKNWKDVGGGMQGNGLSWVSSMLVWRNELYVAGEFFEANGSPGNCIARWDGQKWSRLGSGITQHSIEAAVYDMAIFHDNLYVVGVFSEAGGVNVNNIAKWDGTRWCSLNTAFNQGTPSQIEVAKDEMYISGALWTINGDSVSHMAHWIGGDYVYECGKVEPTAVAGTSTQDQTSLLYPNPATDMLYTKKTGIQTLFIYDATGRIVKVFTTPDLTSGMNISGWSPGFYLAKIVFGDGSMVSSKFVKQ